MKNLKKVLALVVALTMVLGTVSFAFTDVDAENDVYTAVQTLSALDILNGYEDGTFGPEKDITRAEFAAVVCRALDMEASANGAKGATPFTDVPADHWASGYINLAAGQGIVNGYGDGKFGPEDNVTYEQAVKMLVVALGFEPMAAQKGGFPTGYLVVANQYGMTKDVAVSGDSAAANRGVVAQLTYNALDIPMMEQTGFGTNTEYTVQDGKSLRDYKTLLVGLDVAKRDGVVIGTPVINNASVKAGQVNYKVSIGGVYGEAITGLGEGDSKVLDLAEGVYVEDFFGLASTIYLKEVKTNKYEVIAIMAGEASEIVELTVDDLAAPISNTEIKYYESETATKETTLKLGSLAGGAANDVIYNNAAVSFGSAQANDVANWAVDTVITVINNDDDSAYDMIIAKNYAYDIVEEVEADRDRFTLKGAANTMTFDFEDEDVINTIVDKDGNEITLADFAEGDVVAYITSGGFRGFTWAEVINLGQNVVTGTVTETNGNDNTVAVDGVKYELYTGAPAIAVSDEGTFFLTADGKIFAKDTTASLSSNYAYVLEAGFGSSGAFGNAWQLRLLTKDGNIAIYDMKDTFEVEVNSAGTTWNSTKYAATASGSTQAYSSSNPVELANIASDGANHKANYANRLVTYKLDSNNAIKEIRFISGSSYVRNITSDTEFKAAAQTIDGKVIADNAVIFNIDASDMDATKVAEVGSLVDETLYQGLLAKVDDQETEYNCFVVVSGASAIDYTQPIAVVDSKSTGVDADGEDVTKVTYYTANDDAEKVLEINDDTVFVGSNDEDDLVKGTLIMFAADANGVATDVAVIATPAAAASSGEIYAFADAADDAINAEDEIEFVIGYMNTWRTGNKGKVVGVVGSKMYDNSGATTAAANEEIVVTSAVNGYTVVNNTNSSRAYIAVADWQADADIDKYDAPYGTYFFAKLVDGVVEDIVVLGDRAHN